MGRIRALLDWLMARASGDATTRARAWYFAAIWLASLPMLLVGAVQHALQGLTLMAVLDLGGFLVGAASLAVLRARGRIRGVDHASLAYLVLYFSANMLAQTPPNRLQLMFVGFVPLQAAICVGPRAAVGWGGAAMVAGSVALGLADAGYTWPQAAQAPLVEAVVLFCLATLVALSSAIFHDWARQQAFEELKSYESARALLLAHVSHELRTPLNGVVGMAELLRDGRLEGAQVKEAVDVIVHQSHALRSIVDDFLDFSKMEGGHVTVSPVPTDLPALIDEVAALHRTVATRKGLLLEVRRGPGLPAWVSLDGPRVRQVLNNLLSNAIKFTHQGVVTLEAHLEGEGHLRFVVKDTGPGMNEETRARLFQPFAQGDAASTRRHGGTGLGLTISRQLVEAMGGEVAVASAVGEGTRFEVRLPAPAVSPPASSRATAVGASKPLRVLVVDDNAVNRLVAERLLEKLGHRVTCAEDGLQALALMTPGAFDVVLMDCHMPGLDGVETTRRFRAREGDKEHLRIVALTASALKEELDACLVAGMDATLTKPVRREELAAALRG